MTFELRQFQLDGVQKVREALHDFKRVMLYSPTGTGKTEIAMHIIQSAIAKNKRVAFICHRIGLVSQSSKRFWKAGIQHGIIQGDNTFNVSNDVVICSIKTLARRGYPEADLLVIDEAHNCTAGDYEKLLEAYNNVPAVGLSATPFTKGLGQEFKWGKLFDKLIVATTIREAIKSGYLVDCDIYAPSTPDLSQVKIVHGDYHEGQLGIAVDKPKLIGDIIQHWKRLAIGLPTVCFATNIAHSKHICEEFIANGITAEHMDCYTPDDEREAILRRHENGTTTILCNVQVLSEGWDSPKTTCMILARPTRSMTRYIQMVGRALRSYPGKEKALILDHSGTCHRLGYPTDDLPLELNDGCKIEAKDDTPQAPLPRCCYNCHFMIPYGVRVCPKCGAVPVVQDATKVGDGQLEKVQRKEVFTHEQKQEIYSSALGLAEQRGYSDGWASHLYRDITGVWPKGLDNVTMVPVERVLNMAKHKAIKWAKRKDKGNDEAAHV